MFLLLSCVLTALGVAVFPCWRHSARWVYGPSAAVGDLLIVVAVLAAGGRSAAVDGTGATSTLPLRVVANQ